MSADEHVYAAGQMTSMTNPWPRDVAYWEDRAKKAEAELERYRQQVQPLRDAYQAVRALSVALRHLDEGPDG